LSVQQRAPFFFGTAAARAKLSAAATHHSDDAEFVQCSDKKREKRHFTCRGTGSLEEYVNHEPKSSIDEELRAGELRYRTLFDLVPVAVYSTDAQGLIQEFNRRAVQLWGRTPERNKENFCGSFKLFHPDGTPMSHDECPMARILRGEKLQPHELEIIVEQANGTRKNVLVSPSILRDDHGEIIGAINCLYDFTEDKRAQQSLVEAARQQDALYQFVQRRHEAKTLDDIYLAALEAIISVVGCDRASTLLFDAKEVMRFVASRGLSEEYCKAVEGHTPWKADANNPQPVLIENIKDDRVFPSRR
jgi:PAS domain S-box-containing protein